MHTIRLTQYIEGDVLVSVIADPELIAAGGAFIAEFHSAIAVSNIVSDRQNGTTGNLT